MNVRVAVLGVALGAAYVLSPLTVVVGAGFLLLIRWVRQMPDEAERRLLTVMLVAAIGLRAAAIVGLFLNTNHDQVPLGTFFGDEDYFIKRSIWLRNLALGIPISLADVRYAYDDAIQTSVVWLLASIHTLFGPSPYGVRLLSALIYVGGAFALYRSVRPGFGRPASTIGLALLLFLPSLFAWSISVLKEPLFFGLMSGIVWVTMTVLRQRSWLLGALAAGLLVPVAFAAESIRDGGFVVAGVGTVGGVLVGFTLLRRRVAMSLAILVLAAVPFVLLAAPIRDRLDVAIAQAALRHWEHVHAPGHSYMIFDPAFYVNRPIPGDLSPAGTIRMVVVGLVAYVVVPAPWQMLSRSELAYLPEQIVWYAMVVLAVAGLWVGFQRDPQLAAVLVVHLVVAVALVAMTSGNIGTLVRHRALALPYIVWFSGLGLSVLLARLAGARVFVPHPVGAQQGVGA